MRLIQRQSVQRRVVCGDHGLRMAGRRKVPDHQLKLRLVMGPQFLKGEREPRRGPDPPVPTAGARRGAPVRAAMLPVRLGGNYVFFSADNRVAGAASRAPPGDWTPQPILSKEGGLGGNCSIFSPEKDVKCGNHEPK